MIVLVVDDDHVTRTLLSRTLSRLGCNVSTAENGEIALDMIVGGTSSGDHNLNTKPQLVAPMGLDEHTTGHRDSLIIYNYDIIFLDNEMPILSGLEVVAKLRDMGRHDFVVGVTGNALDSDKKEYSEAGVDHILTKPVFESSLVKMLAIAEERRCKAIRRAQS